MRFDDEQGLNRSANLYEQGLNRATNAYTASQQNNNQLLSQIPNLIGLDWQNIQQLQNAGDRQYAYQQTPLDSLNNDYQNYNNFGINQNNMLGQLLRNLAGKVDQSRPQAAVVPIWAVCSVASVWLASEQCSRERRRTSTRRRTGGAGASGPLAPRSCCGCFTGWRHGSYRRNARHWC